MTNDTDATRNYCSIAPRIMGLGILALFVFGLGALVISQWNSPEVHAMVMRHFPVIVGLPAAGIFAYIVVSNFEIASGKIVFKAPGLELSGAGGPILMWIIAYFVIATTIHLLW